MYAQKIEKEIISERRNVFLTIRSHKMSQVTIYEKNHSTGHELSPVTI